MKLTCLRHGLTPSNEAHRYNGSSQEGLTEKQRRDLARIQVDVSGFDAIFCSHLYRTIETARVIGITSFAVDERIAERNLGIFEGLTDEECRARFGEAYIEFRKFDSDYVIPEGESRSQHLSRVLAWLKEVAAGHQNVLAVTHGGTIDFLIRLARREALHGGDRIHGGKNATCCVFDIRWPNVTLLEENVSLQTLMLI